MISGNKAGGGKRWQTTRPAATGRFLNVVTSQHLEYDHVAAFSEKLEWARRLERIERVKAEERRKATLKQNADSEVENFPQRDTEGKTRDIVATKSGFGSGKQYEKAKFIAENADQETIAKLDADEISIHRAWKETKARLEAAQHR